MEKQPCTRFAAVRRLALAVLFASGIAWDVAPAHAQRPSPEARDTLALLGAQRVRPDGDAVAFQQVQFVFGAGRSLDTDGGQVQAEVGKLRRLVGSEGDYLNIALHSSTRGGAAWVVENLRIPPDPDLRTEGIPDERIRAEQIAHGGSDHPMTAYFDLRPDQEGAGRMDRLAATVLISEGALPAVQRVWALVEQIPFDAFAVQPVLVNAEGDLGGTTTPLPTRGLLQFGPPPQPIDPAPELPNVFAFPLEVLQYDPPSINAGNNQCVPIAHALVQGYLRIRDNALPLSWPLPHFSSAGIGLQTSVGDVGFWVAQPTSSRVAQLDSRTRRNGVQDFDMGGGSNRCQNIRGAFSYMATQGDPDQIEYRHQGGSPVYGTGAECDGDITLPLGGSPARGKAPPRRGTESSRSCSSGAGCS